MYGILMILIKQFFWIAYNFYQNLAYLLQRSCLDLKNSESEEPEVFDLIFVFVTALSGRSKRHLILLGVLIFLFSSACSSNTIVALGGTWLLLVPFRSCHTIPSSFRVSFPN